MVTSYIALFWKMYDFSCDITTHCSCTPYWMWLNHWLGGGFWRLSDAAEIHSCLHFFVFLCNVLLTTQEVKWHTFTFKVKDESMCFKLLLWRRIVFISSLVLTFYSFTIAQTVAAQCRQDHHFHSNKTIAICYEPKQPTLFSGNRWLPVL